MSTRRIVLLAVLAIVAVNLLGTVINAATGGTPGGPRSSSYATGDDGLAAYHDLLRESGHPVEQLRRRPSDESLDPSTTLVLLDPTDVLGRDARALRRFVEAGGHLVAGGAERNEWLREIVSPGPVWLRGSDTTTTLKPLAPVPEVAGVNEARTAGKGLWSDSRGTLPALGARDPVITVASVGRGRVVLLADASPLQNGLLAQADNAALGIALAGPAGRRVVFAETVHGYGEARGLAALPERWKWLLVGLLVAGIVWVASRIRRLGPAEDERRPLPPPRRAYVDAVAAALARTRKPSASAERVRTAARRRVARRAGLGSDPSDDRIAAAAATLGLSDEEAAALTRPARDEDEDLLLAGRALARTNGRKR